MPLPSAEERFAQASQRAALAFAAAPSNGGGAGDADKGAELLAALLDGLSRSAFAEIRRHCAATGGAGGAGSSGAGAGAGGAMATDDGDEFEHPALKGRGASDGDGILAEELSAAATLGSPLPPVDAGLARRVVEAEREHTRLAAEVKAARQKVRRGRER